MLRVPHVCSLCSMLVYGLRLMCMRSTAYREGVVCDGSCQQMVDRVCSHVGNVHDGGTATAACTTPALHANMLEQLLSDHLQVWQYERQCFV